MNALGSGNAAAKVPRVSRASDRPFLPGLPEPEWQYGDNPGQPVICRLSELRHHASYVRLRFTVPARIMANLSAEPPAPPRLTRTRGSGDSAIAESQVRCPRTHRGGAPHVRTTFELQCTSSRHGFCRRPEGIGSLLDYPVALQQRQTHAHVALCRHHVSSSGPEERIACFGREHRRSESTDSESSEAVHPGWLKGIRIGSLKDGKVTIFIPGHPLPNVQGGAMGEGIAVDPAGNLYTAETSPGLAGITKYVKNETSEK